MGHKLMIIFQIYPRKDSDGYNSSDAPEVAPFVPQGVLAVCHRHHQIVSQRVEISPSCISLKHL